MFDNNSYFKINYHSEKKFGIFVSLVLIFITAYNFYVGNPIYIWLIASITMLLITLIYSNLLYWPNRIWIKLGKILNLLISPIVMFIIYVITFFPIGLIIKLLNIDLINIKYDRKKQSYWIARKNKMESIKRSY